MKDFFRNVLRHVAEHPVLSTTQFATVALAVDNIIVMGFGWGPVSRLILSLTALLGTGTIL